MAATAPTVRRQIPLHSFLRPARLRWCVVVLAGYNAEASFESVGLTRWKRKSGTAGGERDGIKFDRWIGGTKSVTRWIKTLHVGLKAYRSYVHGGRIFSISYMYCS